MLSIQDIALELVFQKGMSDREAIAELGKTNKLTDLTINSIRDTIDRWRHFHPVKTRDVTEKCYFCGVKVGEEQYCHGCGWWICSECNFGKPTGKHNVKDHLVNEDGKTYNDTVKYPLEQKEIRKIDLSLWW